MRAVDQKHNYQLEWPYVLESEHCMSTELYEMSMTILGAYDLLGLIKET